MPDAVRLGEAFASVARVSAPMPSPSVVGDLLLLTLAQARDRWPTVSVDAEVFAAYVGARIEASESVEVALRGVHGPDLYLACACSRGDDQAIALLERTHRSQILAALGQVAATGHPIEDLLQIVRERLFVAVGDTGGLIAQYAGRGPLSRWLRITALRTGLNATRRKLDHAVAIGPDVSAIGEALADPELEYFRTKYGAAFRDAFYDAIGGVSPRERTLLRLTVGDGLTVREVGRIYQIHFTTAAKWVRDARDALVARTRETLQTRLGITTRELDSIIALVASGIDVSVLRALQSDEPRS